MNHDKGTAHLIDFPSPFSLEEILEKVEGLTDEECKEQYLYSLVKLYPDWRKMLTNLLLHGDTDWKRLSNRAVAVLSDSVAVLSAACETIQREINELETPYLGSSTEVQRFHKDFIHPDPKEKSS